MKAVFLGRFQPFHNGHESVVKKYRDDYDEFCIVIGSSEKEGTKNNPLSFEERKKVIQECFPDLKVLSLADEEKDEKGNKKWISKLEETGTDKVI